jgi:MoaA/NifB/PqqE/SkfB family radical SAM enzyme
MSKLFETVKILHLESTDVCQAACPLCARETDPVFDKDIHNWLSVTDIQRLLPERVIYQLDKMFMCGNYGDPAAGRETLNLYRYFKQVNSNIVLGMNTNGGIQGTYWWTNLAKLLDKPADYVVFSIDGLENTNHIYRKNVSWDRVMRNAESFIAAGGNAQWDMLIYEHNEHQVDACEQLARDMGFKWFRAKVSKRSSNISWLRPPKGYSSPVVNQGPVDCFRNKDSSLYISAKGKIYPCCWLGFGDDTINKFDSIVASWNTNECHTICKKTCSSYNNATSFTNQWQREVQLC